MGFFDRFFKKKSEIDAEKEDELYYKRHNETIRKIHTEKLRFLNDKLERVRRERQLNLAKEELDTEYDDNFEDFEEPDEEKEPWDTFASALMTAIMPKIIPNTANVGGVSANIPPINNRLPLSREQIVGYLKSIPPSELAKFKDMDVNDQMKLLTKMFPTMTENEKVKIIAVSDAEFN